MNKKNKRSRICRLRVCIENIKDSAEYIIGCTFIAALVGGGAAYYLPDNFNDKFVQISDSDINSDNLEIAENGEVYYIFDAGEHKIKMSYNDMLHRKIEMVEGYIVSDVEINGWRDNSQVTFVNEVPVKVKMTSSNDGSLKFENFGEVVEKEIIKSK